MTFEEQYHRAVQGDRFRTEYSVIEKKLHNSCSHCGQPTSWHDVRMNQAVCSLDCQLELVRKDVAKDCFTMHLETYRNEILEEMRYMADPGISKDILIVVHNQLHYLKICIESIEKQTKNYHVYIWDNNSQIDVQLYLKSLPAKRFTVVTSETNIGFVKPNNELARLGTADYIVLLNSDTKVFEGWDRAMIGFMDRHPNVKQVGYLGGVLDEEGKGYRANFGYDIDYVSGWCSCFSREIYNQYGLFDPKLNFAYCEDADFSLRLQTAGYQIYALHLMFVHHYENKTIKAVHQEGKIDVASSFEQNHRYLSQKWANYLASQRVDLRPKNFGLQEQK